MSTPFKDHFSERAATYAAARPTYPPELADFLASIAPRRGLAWDCGCGSGQLSVLLGDRLEQVVGTDASAEQIANATPHPRVRYATAPAEASGLAAGSVDIVVAAQAAHWFDLPRFYAEVKRVARPKAAIALIGYGVLQVEPDLDRVVNPFYWEVVGPYWPPERRLVEQGYRTLEFPFREIEAPPMAITVEWTVDDFLAYVETWSAVGAAERAVGRAPIDEFGCKLRAVWAEGRASRTVRWPLSLRVGFNEPVES